MGMVFNGSKWVYSKGGAGNGRESNNPAPGQKPPRSALYPLLIGQSAPVTGTAIDFVSEGNTQSVKSVDASVSGAGSVSAEVIIEASNDAVSNNWLPIKTITLSGTTSVADGHIFVAPWKFIRARLVSISGTGAVVNSSISV
jgi:hypothetical protein